MKEYDGYCDECNKKTRLFSYENDFLCKECYYFKEVNENHTPITKNKDYSELLKASVQNCEEYDGILKHLPKLYSLLCNIASDPKSNWHTKMLVNSALAYLVIEKDIIPEKDGPKGYLDDLFICAYVLKEIRDKISTKIIIKNIEKLDVENEEQIFDLIYTIFSKSSEYLEEKTEKILKLVGLNKFNLFDLMYIDDKSVNLTKYKKKKNLIYAMLAIKTKQAFFTMRGGLRMEHLKSHLKEHPEFIEISRFMEFNK
jgi:uncharacterized membrane protein YkvA (DUF1232 family)